MAHELAAATSAMRLDNNDEPQCSPATRQETVLSGKREREGSDVDDDGDGDGKIAGGDADRNGASRQALTPAKRTIDDKDPLPTMPQSRA